MPDNRSRHSSMPLPSGNQSSCTATSGLTAAILGTAAMGSMPSLLTGAQANLAYLSGAALPSPALGPIGLGPVGGTPGSGLGGLTNAITVSMGRAKAIGPMSVPAAWSSPSSGHVAPLQPAGLTTLPGTDELAGSGYPGVPGMPAGTIARASGVLPRYGTRLNVMTRPPAGG